VLFSENAEVQQPQNAIPAFTESITEQDNDGW
jgi:hypothetical protein